MVDLKKIDTLLLSLLSREWRKVAMVIGTAMLERMEDHLGVDDVFLSKRVQQLASDGKVESRGDLNHIRYSEIRLADGSAKAISSRFAAAS